jgi:hypothetical protein
MARKALLTQAPEPSATITEPDHLRRLLESLAPCFSPQARREGIKVAQDGHQPALPQPGGFFGESEK